MATFSRMLSQNDPIIIIQVSPYYGLVVFVGIASGILLTWQAIQVGKLRKKLQIKYPTMYSADTEGDGHLFNCVQRAHQNTLENYSQFLMLLFTGGLQYPIPAALGGSVWIAGRVAYSLGYYTGDPKKRMQGSFGYLGLFTLLGCSSIFGAKLLGWL